MNQEWRKEECGRWWEGISDEYRNFEGAVEACIEDALWEAMGEYGYGRLPKLI